METKEARELYNPLLEVENTFVRVRTTRLT